MMERNLEMQELVFEMESYAEDYAVPILRAAERDLLLRIAAEHQPKRILEIGTAIGYSALLLAEAAPAAQILTMELDEERARKAAYYFSRSPYANRISQRIGDAREILLHLEEEYDLLFLDAAKGQYLSCLQSALPHLSENAVILADNVLFRGYVQAEEKPPRRYRTIVQRLRTYLDFVRGRDFSTEIYPDGDGMAVTRRIHGNS